MTSRADWHTAHPSKLWLYNLHYHSFLLENIPLEAKVAILNRWIKENPRPNGCGWDPYPLSLRIVNWVKFFITYPSCINEELIYSFLEQCESLFCQIEYHLLGNHLFENAKALVIAGLVLQGERAQKFLATGIQILEHELEEQIQADGAHFERSPMYHCIILEGALDLYHIILLFRQEGDKKILALKQLLAVKIQTMLSALEVLTHPDGEIAFFNDSTLGIAPRPVDLRGYAAKLGFSCSSSSTILENVGFIKLENSYFSIIIDGGNIGPSYIPGHAHAESLSFECSFLKERLFVNTGVSTYDTNEKRSYQRSTSAHNCVSFKGGQSTAEVWASFRVAKRPVVQQKGGLSKTRISLNLTKIPKLPKRFTHNREFILKNDQIHIQDTFYKAAKVFSSSKEDNLTKEIHYHLHPNWEINEVFEDGLIVTSLKSTAQVRISFYANTDITYEIKDYNYAAGFNYEVTSKKIIIYCSSLTHFCQSRVYIKP
ncbi:heparinase II/III family protein [Candidatus Paracaedibacter symbiosus]|uniref:heparinase II/III family protein n=1 Tax=Candidatus Paracaedibacter symbiosus TaxID=244582 RepID=UPI0018DB5D8E|nr:heparinase II/III family protein [Candidatus Paracaedibacter symbiosus]